jgi:hypothetical protein
LQPEVRINSEGVPAQGPSPWMDSKISAICMTGTVVWLFEFQRVLGGVDGRQMRIPATAASPTWSWLTYREAEWRRWKSVVRDCPGGVISLSSGL